MEYKKELEKWDRKFEFKKASLLGLRFYMGSVRRFGDQIVGSAWGSQDPTFELIKNYKNYKN